MTIQAAWQILYQAQTSLREELQLLAVMLREDKPLEDDSALVDILGDPVDDLLGLLTEMQTAVHKQLSFGSTKTRSETAVLLTVQDKATTIQCQFYELTAYEQLNALAVFAHEQKGEWREWGRSVQETLSRCGPLLCDLFTAVHGCWQEGVEKAGGTAVYGTNIGQIITIPKNGRNKL